MLSISQAKVSLLVNGKTDDFSIDTLMGFLTKLDQDVQIVVKRKPRSHPVGELSVAM
jgi:predicted XRE-type DNA-binding protein